MAGEDDDNDNEVDVGIEESRRSEMKKPVPRLLDERTSFGVECTGFWFLRSTGLEVVSAVAVLGASSCDDVLDEA